MLWFLELHLTGLDKTFFSNTCFSYSKSSSYYLMGNYTKFVLKISHKIATGKRFTTIQIFSGQLVCLISGKLTETANKLEGKLFCTKECSRPLAGTVTTRNGAMVERKNRHTLGFFLSHTDFSSTTEQNWALQSPGHHLYLSSQDLSSQPKTDFHRAHSSPVHTFPTNALTRLHLPLEPELLL